MANLKDSNKERIRNSIILGAQIYKNKLIPYDFLVITDDYQYYTVRFNAVDFAHLIGIDTVFSDKDLFENCVKGTISKENIKTNQHYNFGTLKQKSNRIEKIHKIIYAKNDAHLILINLHTNTRDFPLAIENTDDKMVVAFVGKDHCARSLRKNNSTECDKRKTIIGIYAKSKGSSGKYNVQIYLKKDYFLTSTWAFLIDEKYLSAI